MATWIEQDTGEIVEGDCPKCATTRQWAEDQVRKMEQERRGDRAKVTRLERQAERDEVKRRDGETWKRALNAWLEAFPDKRPTAKGIKSARATKVFLRLETGATIEDLLDAILGAKEFPYVVYGKRVKTGSKSDIADDLEDICAISRDREFDFLRDAGAAKRAEMERASF